MEIKLKKPDADRLGKLTRENKVSTRIYKRARILLCLNEGKEETDIANILGVGRTTVWRTAIHYIKGGLDAALTERPRPGQPRKYTKEQEAEIIAIACTNPPTGRRRWSVRLLTTEIKHKKGFKTMNRESVRLILKKVNLNLG